MDDGDGDRSEAVRRIAWHGVGTGAWLPRLYLGFAAALLPWSGYLAVSLPQRSISPHYDTTWVGFDLILMIVLARIGWLAHRRNPHVVLAAAVGATLLLADAWFDITTAASGPARTHAVASAVLLELPTAGLSLLLARRGLAVLIAGVPAGRPPDDAPDPSIDDADPTRQR